MRTNSPLIGSNALAPVPSKPINIAEHFAAMEAQRAASTRDCYLSDPLATVLVVFSMLIMSFSSYFGPVLILVFFAMWFSPILFKGLHVIKSSYDMLLVLSIPFFGILSTLWSDYPGKTLYTALSFFSMMLCVVVMSRVVRFQALAQGVTLGISVCMLITLASGKYETDYVTGAYSLVGYYGSKNSVGFVAEIGLLFSLISFQLYSGYIKKIMLSLIPCLICAWCLHLGGSSTALLSFLGAITMVYGFYIIVKLPKSIRQMVLLIGCIGAVGALSAAFLMGADELLLQLLGKDATLTGRTRIWQVGIITGLERPVLGHGYAAFWMPGRPVAEQLWHDFLISGKAGFHFHSTFIQFFVDLGLIGASLISLLLLINCISSFRLALKTNMLPEAAALLGLSTMFLIRSFFEVDTGGPFGVGTLFFFMIIIRMHALKRRELPKQSTGIIAS